jgi:HD-GYP domain-containing protein (c-di-GMP phosphodiesterase class II)
MNAPLKIGPRRSKLPVRSPMSGLPLHTVGEAEVESARARLCVPAAPAERLAGRILGVAFLTGAAVLAAAGGLDAAWSGVFVVLAALYAIAGLVEFEVGSIHTDCSLAALAAMLVALPPAMIPWCVAAGATLSAVSNVVRRMRHVSRIVPAVSQLALPTVAAAAVLTSAQPVSSWSDLPVIAAALVAYIVADLVSAKLFARIAFGQRLTLPTLGDGWVCAVDLLLAPLGIAMAIAADGREWALALVFLPLAFLLWVFAKERRSRIDHALELSQAYRGTAMLLGDVVESDDAYTGSHSRDVVELAVEVGRRLGLGAEALRDLEFGALLHDVGKIAVPKEIINKPGKLTAEEWEIMKRHTVDGQRMLENVGGVLARVGVIVRASHEDYDGTGYPDGLAGEEIPVEARICSACDAYSAMTTDRSYRSAMTRDDAVAELRRCAGTQFDPRVVDALIGVIAHDAVARVETAAPATRGQAAVAV